MVEHIVQLNQKGTQKVEILVINRYFWFSPFQVTSSLLTPVPIEGTNTVKLGQHGVTYR